MLNLCCLNLRYLVRAGAPHLSSVGAVDKPGVHVAASTHSAYALWLSQNLRFATLVTTTEPELEASLRLFLDESENHGIENGFVRKAAPTAAADHAPWWWAERRPWCKDEERVAAKDPSTRGLLAEIRGGIDGLSIEEVAAWIRRARSVLRDDAIQATAGSEMGRSILEHKRMGGSESASGDVRAIDALAGLRPWLVEVAARTNEPGLLGCRVLDGSFTVVRQAIGFPSGSDSFGFLDEAALGFLTDWVSAATARGGLIEGLVAKHGVVGKLSVAGHTVTAGDGHSV